MRPHAVITSFPASGQINPMLELAKLLHLQGFHITFVNTDFSHRRILSYGRCDELNTSDRFQFKTIPDGHSSSGSDQFDMKKMLSSARRTCPAALGELLQELSSSMSAPPITCVIANFLMPYVVDVGRKLGFPVLVFWTTSACSLLGSLHLQELIRRGYTPLKDQSFLTNGYMDTPIDWIPGMKGIRLRDLSSFIRTTDLDDFSLNMEMDEANCALRAAGLILNTFDHLEGEVLEAIKSFFPRIYAIGPLVMLRNQMKCDPRNLTRLSLWEEDYDWKEWLSNQRKASVIYVSFGSLVTLTREQLAEFAWGLADSNHTFLWIIRPNLIDNGHAALPEEFIKETAGRSFFAGWCHQSKVLSHPSIGGFLTHSGWNSMLESVCSGLPMILWPRFVDQFTNCRYACKEWGIGMEIDQEVKREQVKELVRELMEGERGQQMRKNAIKLKEMAEQATREGGTSYANMERLTKHLNLEKIEHDLGSTNS